MRIEAITAPNPGPYTLTGTQSYVLEERVVIDPGPAIDSHIDALHRSAPALRAIVITHRHADHAPAAIELRARTGAPIYASRSTLPDNDVDHLLQDDEWIDCDSVRLRAIATPGHTAEHFCFVTEEGDLFTGDTVLGAGTTVIFPPDGDMGAYFQTLQRLIALEPSRIFPGHGPVRDDAVELLREYLSHRRMREQQILAALPHAKNAAAIRQVIYPGLDPRLEKAAELQIEAHLAHLKATARI